MNYKVIRKGIFHYIIEYTTDLGGGTRGLFATRKSAEKAIERYKMEHDCNPKEQVFGKVVIVENFSVSGGIGAGGVQGIGGIGGSGVINTKQEA